MADQPVVQLQHQTCTAQHSMAHVVRKSLSLPSTYTTLQ
jgi:hypothetical protein